MKPKWPAAAPFPVGDRGGGEGDGKGYPGKYSGLLVQRAGIERFIRAVVAFGAGPVASKANGRLAYRADAPWVARQDSARAGQAPSLAARSGPIRLLSPILRNFGPVSEDGRGPTVNVRNVAERAVDPALLSWSNRPEADQIGASGPTALLREGYGHLRELSAASDCPLRIRNHRSSRSSTTPLRWKLPVMGSTGKGGNQTVRGSRRAANQRQQSVGDRTLVPNELFE